MELHLPSRLPLSKFLQVTYEFPSMVDLMVTYMIVHVSLANSLTLEGQHNPLVCFALHAVSGRSSEREKKLLESVI